MAVAAGCSKAPARQSLQGWILEEAREVGPCWFRMDHAWLFHSTEWNLQIDMRVENTGGEQARCAYDIRAVSDSGESITESVSGAVTLRPEGSRDVRGSAIETHLTGIQGGPGEGAWVYVELTHGYWPVGDTIKLHATPSRERPPSEDAWNPR